MIPPTVRKAITRLQLTTGETVTSANWLTVLDRRLTDLAQAEDAVALYRAQAARELRASQDEARQAAAELNQAIADASRIDAERLTPNHLGLAVRLRIDSRVHEGNLTGLNATADLIDEHPLSEPGPRYVVGRRRIELTLDGRWTFRVLGTDTVELIEQGGGA